MCTTMAARGFAEVDDAFPSRSKWTMDDACGRMLPVDMQFAMELLSLASAFGFGVDPQVKFGWFYSPPLLIGMDQNIKTYTKNLGMNIHLQAILV